MVYQASSCDIKAGQIILLATDGIRKARKDDYRAMDKVIERHGPLSEKTFEKADILITKRK